MTSLTYREGSLITTPTPLTNSIPVSANNEQYACFCQQRAIYLFLPTNIPVSANGSICSQHNIISSWWVGDRRGAGVAGLISVSGYWRYGSISSSNSSTLAIVSIG